ncbi:hypothetical protein EIP86_007825 [Pleurotus ostreatoroseus]|nr:hypothetical protein EIP86_007825 [Pleurotus ostreatoroseus]
MSAFEPAAVRAIIRQSLSPDKRANFEKTWNDTVADKLANWFANRPKQAVEGEQLEFAANVVAYTNFIWSEFKPHGNAKPGTLPLPLPINIPLYGPRFVPPTYLHARKRSPGSPKIQPVTNYIKPVSVVHPFYFPNFFKRCPQCDSVDDKEVYWDSWISTGPREVYGLKYGETAIGYQLRCKACKNRGLEWCFATTSAAFWAKSEAWSVPRGVPIFFYRAAVSRDLYDYLIEMRPSTTSAGLAENVRREYNKLNVIAIMSLTAQSPHLADVNLPELHLQEYKLREYEYLLQYRECLRPLPPLAFRKVTASRRDGLAIFNELVDTDEGDATESARALYGERSISADFITDIYLDCDNRTRQQESAEYVKTLSGRSLSLDATFKLAKKAVVVTKNKARIQVAKGGLVSVINERNEIVAWRLCRSQANEELQSILEDLAARFQILKAPKTEEVLSDNCCHIAVVVFKAMPEAHLGLDVYHFLTRYTAMILNKSKSPWYLPVAREIADAIYETRATATQHATYRTRHEQESRLQATFEKYSRMTGVWAPGAERTHGEQIGHVKKGCLTRRLQDIAADGSRIEGSHKTWNSLQRAQPSGLEMVLALGADLVLRRNIRVRFGSRHKQAPATGFVASTHGCHHVRLCNEINQLFNQLAEEEQKRGTVEEYTLRPVLPRVDTPETFGLSGVSSEGLLELEGLLQIKDDPEDEDENVLQRTITEADIELPKPDIIANACAATTAPSMSLCTHAEFQLARDGLEEVEPPVIGQRSDKAIKLCAKLEPVVIDLTSTESTSNDNLRECGGSSKTSQVKPSSLKRKEPEFDCAPTSTIVDAVTTIEVNDAAPNSKRAKILPAVTLSKVCGQTLFSTTSLLNKMQETQPSSAAQPIRGTLDGFFSLKRTDHLAIAVNAAVEQPSASATSSTEQTPVQDESSGLSDKGEASKNSSSNFTSRLTALRTRLPDLQSEETKGLSRSERIFHLHTGINPHSLRIEKFGTEHFTFMNLRLERKWASYEMTPRGYLSATEAYNDRLAEDLTKEGKKLVVKKTAHALMEKLAEVEACCIDRIITDNFKSKSGDEDYWRKHCSVVSLGANAVEKSNETKKKNRKPQTCSRCKMIKYVAALGSQANHKKHHCSDGVKSTHQTDPPPRWPQPAGLFSNGTHFHPIVFLENVHRLHEYNANGYLDGQTAMPMELAAFAHMLDTRKRIVTSQEDNKKTILFKLFPYLTCSPPNMELIEDLDGARYLRIDCMSDA